MKRDLDRLASTNFDVVVVGGGITGAAIALVLAGQGFETALVEKDDFCAATSANSLKIIHGGLRYLQQADFRRMRSSIRCRKAFMQFAPGRVTPLPCMMPLYGYGLASRETAWMALKINDLISLDRNRGMDAGHWIPTGKIASGSECLRRFPMLASKGLRGGCQWTDAIAPDSERLTLDVVMAAHARGACVANYVRTERLAFSGGTVKRVCVTDVLGNKAFEINARRVVNATGPWLHRLLPHWPGWEANRPRLALGMNLIVKKRLFPHMAVGLEGRFRNNDRDAAAKKGKRAFFFVPLGNHTMVGTSYRLFDGSPDRLNIDGDDIAGFVRQINRLYPPARLSMADVSSFHAGLLPAKATAGAVDPGRQLLKHPLILDHGRLGEKDGVISVLGVKFTTAFQVAKDTAGLLGKMIRPKYPARAARPGRAGVSAPPVDPGPGDSRRPPEKRFLRIRRALDEEMAFSLADLVLRRLGLGRAACPDLDDLTAMAGYAGQIAGWDARRTRLEIQGVVRRFLPLPRAVADMKRLEDQYEDRHGRPAKPALS